MTKKIAFAFVTAMVGFSFTGCASDSDTPTATVTVTAPATTDTADEDFADTVREGAPYFDAAQTEDIVALAETICTAFDEGAGFMDIGNRMVDAGAPVYDTGFTIGASVAYVCPEHESDLTIDSPNA